MPRFTRFSCCRWQRQSPISNGRLHLPILNLDMAMSGETPLNRKADNTNYITTKTDSSGRLVNIWLSMTSSPSTVLTREGFFFRFSFVFAALKTEAKASSLLPVRSSEMVFFLLCWPSVTTMFSRCLWHCPFPFSDGRLHLPTPNLDMDMSGDTRSNRLRDLIEYRSGH